jgi:hypothetical protein
MHRARSNLLFGFLLALAGASSTAHADMIRETAYLASIEGKWIGSGSVRLLPGTPSVTVSCKLSGEAEAGGADLSGRCSGFLLNTSVNAKLRYSGKAKSYSGSWSTGDNNAKLSGLRRGKGLSLAVSEPDEPARLLTISLSHAALVIVMTRVDDGAQVLRLALSNRGRATSGALSQQTHSAPVSRSNDQARVAIGTSNDAHSE